MNRMEEIERSQRQDYSLRDFYNIPDQLIVDKKAEQKAARDARSNKALLWVSTIAAVIGTIAAILALI